MPVYDYKCGDHGVFHELVTMDESSHKKPCPQCQTLSARVILVAPSILTMDSNKRDACACNERAQHEPKHSAQLLRPDSMQSAINSTKNSRTLFSADGKKSFPTHRPWMISH